jgi:hypothetical protein
MLSSKSWSVRYFRTEVWGLGSVGFCRGHSGGLYVFMRWTRKSPSSPSTTSTTTKHGLDKGWVSWFRIRKHRSRVFRVQVMALHIWPVVCRGRWVSHLLLYGRPSCISPSGFVSERRVATVPIHGSCIISISKLSSVCNKVEMRSLDNCTFIILTRMGRSDIFKGIILNVVDPGLQGGRRCRGRGSIRVRSWIGGGD